MPYRLTKISSPVIKGFLFIALVFLFFQCQQQNKDKENQTTASKFQTPVQERIVLDSTVLGVSTIISDLDVPWEIAWGPDNWIWFTEQGGRVSRVDPSTGVKVVLLEIPNVFRKRTTGLMGMAIYPRGNEFPYVVLNYTFKEGDSIRSKLVRYTYTGKILEDPKDLLVIPGNTSHNGTRVTISPDRKVIWATGDIGPEVLNAQDIHSLNGKILRLNIDGSIPMDNPFPDSPIWSWGHRNHQGLAFGKNNLLYTSEHGDASDDELNVIKKGGNYGWPYVTGYCDQPEEMKFCTDSTVIPPLKAWTPTIAPAGLDFYNAPEIPEWQNSLLLTTLKENDLRVLKLDSTGTAIISEKIYLDHGYGRLRDLCVSPIGDVYVGTSNRDWNPGEGYPKKGDDRILRIFKISWDTPIELDSHEPSISTNLEKTEPSSKGEVYYGQYCASCHKPDGEGVLGTFPPLKGSEVVLGDKRELIHLILNGLSGKNMVKGEEYDQSMPAFSFLKDREVSEILTYVHTHFGNADTTVSTQEVNEVRNSLDL